MVSINFNIAFFVFITNFKLGAITCTEIQLPTETTELLYISKVEKGQTHQTIVYLKENYDDYLIISILKTLQKTQAVLLMSGNNVSNYAVNNRSPNIIVVIKTLDAEDFNAEAFKIVLLSFWSYVHFIVITNNEQYNCVNGTLSDDTLNETKIYLNRLWHKYKIARVMMSFPYTCPDQYIMYDGKDESAPGKYYNRTIRVIRSKNTTVLLDNFIASGRHLAVDYPIRVNIFDRFPTSITECDVIDLYTTLDNPRITPFCGLDGMIMEDFFAYYKYDIVFTSEDNCNFYGYVDTENNVTTGSLGCIIDDKIDISFNSRFLWLYSTDSYHFLHFIAQDSLCPVMRRPDEKPLWHYASNAYSPTLSIAILAVLSLLGFSTWVSVQITSRYSKEKTMKLYSYWQNSVISTLFGIILHRHRRFLTLQGTSLVCSVVLLALYQGHINYQFTTTSHYDNIKTVQQLLDSSSTLITSPSIMVILNSTVNRNTAFSRRIRVSNLSNYEHIETIIKNSQIVTVARGNDVMIDVLKNHNDNQTSKTPKVFVMDECFQSMLLSYLVNSAFLFIEESTKFMMHLVESGLPDQYFIWTRRAYNLADRFPSVGSEPRPFQPIDLMTVRSSFIFLLVGYVVSGMVFAVEKIKGKR